MNLIMSYRLLLAGLVLAMGVPLVAHAQTYTRTEVMTYHDNTTKWVLGQIAQVTCVAPTSALPAGCGASGTIMSETTYDPTYALPLTSRSFGKLQQTLTYDTTSVVASGQLGTLRTVADGNNNITTLSSWKRGIPQTIQYPATPESPGGATKSAIVDNNGWIASVTDENGFTTNYSYDLMGRLDRIVYPTGDTTGWNDTTFTWEYRNIAEHGLPAGHWLRSKITGNGYKNVFFDAMRRPVLIHEFDAANISGTLRATSTEYDSSGRTMFQSYPSNSTIPAASGTWTSYDALDRVTSVKQDSEHGQLITTTEYLQGFQTQVTNPKGKQTLSVYRAYDIPNYDQPHGISELGGDRHTEIYRDIFGKPYQVRRRNGYGNESAWRYYVYDNYQQLCKTIEPETGATIYDYDGAGNLAWSAGGLTAPDAGTCERTNAYNSGRRVTRTYDARNRPTQLLFPDGRGNQLWTHTADGLAAQITTWNEINSGGPVVNAYSYNKRRMLTGESVQQPNWYGWGIGYGYDANGSLSTQTYPTSFVVNYAPNALGQATQAGGYASGVQYHPNGGIKQFTYGNGLVHTMTQNARQLPARVTDSGNVMDFEYGYDKNANVSYINDYVIGTPTPQNRGMGYDGLDRLLWTYSIMYGVSPVFQYTYDALDNLRSAKLDRVKDYAQYVYDPASNLLTNIKDSNGATIVGLGYDEQGNIRNKNGRLHDFDYGNRLRSTPEEWYRYDGSGRRVLNWRGNEPGVLSQYSHSGQLLYDENYRASGRKSSTYIYLAGSLVATNEWNFDIGTAATKYQHTDGLGSPVAVTDAAGAVIERTNYEPYGAAFNKPNYDGIGYTGHVMDSATGLTYMQQRYYDPAIGRFLSVDPVTANSQTGANFNRYWYAGNNPYKFMDPDGRYNCEASSGQCEQTERAMRMIRKAQMNATGPGRVVLNNIVTLLGKKNDGNGIVIRSTSNPADAGSWTNLAKGGILRVNFDSLNGSYGFLGGKAQDFMVGSTIVHEGWHGSWAKLAFSAGIYEPWSRAFAKNNERRASISEGVLAQALQFDHPQGFWTRNGGFDHQKIDAQAEESVNSYCAASARSGLSCSN
jgi:RHS repeat-associated protein